MKRGIRSVLSGSFYKWWEGPPSALWATRSCSCLIQRLIRPDSFSCWILVLNLDQVNHVIERHVIWTSLYRASPFEEHKPHQRGKDNPGRKIRVPSFMIYVQSWQPFPAIEVCWPSWCACWTPRTHWWTSSSWRSQAAAWPRPSPPCCSSHCPEPWSF